MNKLMTEFVGTFFLVLTIVLSVSFGGVLAPVGIAIMLIALVHFGGPISGAHYNPAVTLALFVRGKCKAGDVPTYVLAQLLGAGGGAAVGAMLAGAPVIPAPGEGVSLINAAIAETLFTFILSAVILNVATLKKTAGNQYFGVAIGLTVGAAAIAIGKVSGAVLNPAVGVGLCAVGGKMQHMPLYIVAPLGGGLLAGLFFRVQNPEE